MKRTRNKKGIKLFEMIVVVSIAAIIISFAIPSILRSKMNAEDVYALHVLRDIAAAAEEYARGHNGNYPGSLSTLANENYLRLSKTGNLPQDSITTSMNGFNITCAWTPTSYSCTATPLSKGIFGMKIMTKLFTLRTGMRLSERDITIAADGSVVNATEEHPIVCDGHD